MHKGHATLDYEYRRHREIQDLVRRSGRALKGASLEELSDEDSRAARDLFRQLTPAEAGLRAVERYNTLPLAIGQMIGEEFGRFASAGLESIAKTAGVPIHTLVIHKKNAYVKVQPGENPLEVAIYPTNEQKQFLDAADGFFTLWQEYQASISSMNGRSANLERSANESLSRQTTLTGEISVATENRKSHQDQASDPAGNKRGTHAGTAEKLTREIGEKQQQLSQTTIELNSIKEEQRKLLEERVDFQSRFRATSKPSNLGDVTAALQSAINSTRQSNAIANPSTPTPDYVTITYKPATLAELAGIAGHEWKAAIITAASILILAVAGGMAYRHFNTPERIALKFAQSGILVPTGQTQNIPLGSGFSGHAPAYLLRSLTAVSIGPNGVQPPFLGLANQTTEIRYTPSRNVTDNLGPNPIQLGQWYIVEKDGVTLTLPVKGASCEAYPDAVAVRTTSSGLEAIACSYQMLIPAVYNPNKIGNALRSGEFGIGNGNSWVALTEKDAANGFTALIDDARDVRFVTLKPAVRTEKDGVISFSMSLPDLATGTPLNLRTMQAPDSSFSTFYDSHK